MLQNPNPIIYERLETSKTYDLIKRKQQEMDLNTADEFDDLES